MQVYFGTTKPLSWCSFGKFKRRWYLKIYKDVTISTMTLFALSYFLRRWCLRFGIKLANAMEWLPRIFSASLSIPCFHPCNLSHEYLPNECFIKPLSSSHHLFHGHHLYRKGLQFCFRNRYSAIIFATKKNMVLWCNVILVGLKILLPAGTFVRTFFQQIYVEHFLSTSIGLPAGTIRTLPRGGGHSLVSLDASEISIFFPN